MPEQTEMGVTVFYEMLRPASSRIDMITECYKNAALITAESNCQDSEVGFLLNREGTYLAVNSSGLKNAAL